MLFNILTLIPGRKKTTAAGWTSFNAPCCHHRGHRADRRGRGGIKFDGKTNWSYHCFNCHFKCGFTLGKTFSQNLRTFLGWLNVEETIINKWSLESLQYRDLVDLYVSKKKKLKLKFNEVKLPDGEKLSDKNPKHEKFSSFIKSRGLDCNTYPFLITPHEAGRNSNRIIIPYTYKGKNVGFMNSYIDGRGPKYVKDQQPGYVFGLDLQKPQWEVCIVVEGIYDALSINGCALTHDTITDEQAMLLRSLEKRVIVVPDLDKSGLSIIDRALELGFEVSIPDWAPGIKDTNDAILKYGKLPTILSILHNATNSKIKIQMKRNKIAKRI